VGPGLLLSTCDFARVVEDDDAAAEGDAWMKLVQFLIKLRNESGTSLAMVALAGA